jgi:hypothetical protein
VSPTSGVLGGGTAVVIHGSGFSGVTGVTFGGAGAASTFTVLSSTEITAVSPSDTTPSSGNGGTVDITVTTSTTGTSATSSADHFTYAKVTSVVVNGDYSPIVGMVSSGGTVTVTTDGYNGFTAGDQVVIEGYTSANTSGYDGTFSIVTTTSANTFTVPNGTPGLATLTNNSVGFAISANSSSGTNYLEGKQRSMVDSVVYNFNTQLVLTTSQFVLSTVAPNVIFAGPVAPSPAAAAPNMVLTSLNNGASWVLSWTSAAGNNILGHSIADGVYDLTLTNSGQSLVNAQTTEVFYRLYGDALGVTGGDARVNASDNQQFANTFLVTNGLSAYQPAFDYLGNGKVNASDNQQFANRFLSTWNGFSPTI